MRIYRDIIKSSWHILWRYAWLWPFGLLAAVIGNGGEYGALISAVDRVSRQGNILASLRETVQYNSLSPVWAEIQQSFASAPAYFATTLFLLLVALLVLVWLIIVSQAALIKAASDIDEDKTTSFREVAIEGNKHFWPILFLNFLARFVVWLLLAVSITSLFVSFLAKGNNAEFDALILISYLVLVPLAFIISFIIKYAVIAVVLDKQSWWPALTKAVKLFFRNWLVSLEMAAILFAINYMISLVVFSLVAKSLITAPVVFALRGINFATIIMYLPQMLLLIAVGAWFSTFQYSAWTILYRRLTQGQIVPKLLRAADDIPIYLEKWFKRNPPSLPQPPQKSR